MTPKWTIRKYPIREDGSRPLYPWFAFPPGVTPPEGHRNAFVTPSEIFRTFPEALAYVESQTRKTRTVEVELPKVVRKAYIDPRPFAEMAVIDKGEYGVQILFSDDHFRLLNSDLKPLGEYLLALHYEKENNEATQRSLPEF